MLKYGGIVLAPALFLLTGCPPPRAPGVAPRDEQQALSRVNENLGQIRAPVQYNGYATFSFRDAKGKSQSYRGQEAVLIYDQPQNLRFDIRSLAGTVAQFGSNNERFWVWVEPEVNKMWCGRWGTAAGNNMPLPADDLIDSLMLRPLPAMQANGSPPGLRRGDGTYYLVYERAGGVREVRLDSSPPYQPVEIIDRLPDNRVEMRAVLGSYRRIGGDGPYTPRRYVIYWPLDESEMRFDVLRAVFRPELPAEAFAFPAGWQGEVEELDVAVQ